MQAALSEISPRAVCVIRNYDIKKPVFLTNSIQFHTIAPKIRQQDSG